MLYLVRHGDTFTVDESEDFIVVHDRVHALDPQSVDRTIENDPLLIWFLIYKVLKKHLFHCSYQLATNA